MTERARKVMKITTPLLLLDIDGTVRHGKDELGRFVNTPEDVIVFPEAAEQMRNWKNHGGRIAGISNQDALITAVMRRVVSRGLIRLTIHKAIV